MEIWALIVGVKEKILLGIWLCRIRIEEAEMQKMEVWLACYQLKEAPIENQIQPPTTRWASRIRWASPEPPVTT